jgi:MFS family permease
VAVTPPDQEQQASTTSIFSARYRTLTLGIIAIITIAAFEASAVITAMPVAARDLDALPWYAWTFTAFSAASLFAMVMAGEVADRRGPTGPLAFGMVAFGVGSAIAGVAPDMAVLLVGRAVQGIGSGCAIVAAYVVIGKTYPEDMRPRVFTAMSGAWLVPGIAGPAIAGVLADTVGWRWVFLSVLVLIVPIAAVLLPRLRALHLRGDPSIEAQRGRKRRAFLAAVGLATLQAGGQLLDLAGLLLAVVGLVLLAASVPRLLPAGALRLARGLPTVVSMRGLMAGAFFGAESFIPLMLVNERGMATAAAGLALSGAVIGWFIGSWYQGRPSTTTPRWTLLQVGAGLVTLGILTTMVTVLPAVPALLVLVTWGGGAFGMGMLYATLGVLLLQLSPAEEQGVNSAALQVSDSLGSVLCTGLAGVIFAAGHSTAGQDAAVFAVIFATMAVIAGFATVVAPRVRPVAG